MCWRLWLGESLIEKFKIQLLEMWVAPELLDQLFLAEVARPEIAPLMLLFRARYVELPMNVLARLPADGAGHRLDHLIAAIRLFTRETDPGSITHADRNAQLSSRSKTPPYSALSHNRKPACRPID